VYVIDPTAFVWQDDSQEYTMRVQLASLDFGTRHRKSFTYLELVGDIQNETATTNVSWSDDDYQSYSTSRAVDMATNRPRLQRCGTAYRRAFVLENATNTPWAAEALELEIDNAVV
jgi:hypothetical protein